MHPLIDDIDRQLADDDFSDAEWRAIDRAVDRLAAGAARETADIARMEAMLGIRPGPGGVKAFRVDQPSFAHRHLARYGCQRVPGVRYKLAPGREALDISAVPEGFGAAVNTRAMSARLCFAAGFNRDRVGDVLNIGGIDTAQHEQNPIVLLEHGKFFPMPIAKAEDPAGRYTVVLDTDQQVGWATTYFTHSLKESEQTFALIAEGLIRAGSIGYRTLSSQPLRPDYESGHKGGHYLHRTELLEISWVIVPANGAALRSCLDHDRVAGKSLAAGLRRSLEPFAEPRRAWARGASFAGV